MLKRMLMCSFLVSLLSQAQAAVIDLDNLSAAHCQQQLTTYAQKIEPLPVVLMYMKDCPWAKKLMPIYEEVANEYPNRPFFRYEYSEADPLVAHYCFNGVMPYVSPQIYSFYVMASFQKDRSGQVLGIEKAGLDGAATKQDIIDFLGLNTRSAQKAFSLKTSPRLATP